MTISSINPTKLQKLEPAAFSVSSRVALQLGRESISGSITAIVELVKNSYDADAESVHIRFANAGTKNCFLVIEDNGNGMDENDLRNNWLVIGTANKTKYRTTKKQRVVTGEKGLGRLGLDRLSLWTEVESIKEGSNEGIRLDINWELYESEDQRLETVMHNLYRLPSLSADPITDQPISYPKGTRLILRGLKDDWNEVAITELRNELALLISPFQASNDFAINIDTNGVWKKLDGTITVTKPILEAANWKVTASLDEENNITIQMASARHKTAYHFGPIPWSEAIKKQGTLPACGPVSIEFYFFVRKAAALSTQILKAAAISEFLDYNQGVRIYRDGFRVKPYGEPDGGGDWLRLAFRRMQSPEGVTQKKPGTWRVGYNQLVGAVFISHEKNPALNDQTNREGLLQGKAFDHLQVFANRVIQFFEIHNQLFERGKKDKQIAAEKAETKALSSIKEVDRAIEEIEEIAADLDNNAFNNGKDVQKAMASLQLRLVNVSSELKISTNLFLEANEQKNTIANLASLGILAAAFGHETLDWTGTVLKNSNWLLESLAKGLFMVKPDIEEEIISVLNDTANEARKVNKFARFTLGNLSRDKRQRKNFSLSTTIKKVFTAFDEVLKIQKEIDIDLSLIPSNACLINGYEMDWESILVNLITNATWALDGIDKQRKIMVAIEDKGLSWSLQFSDSGVGIEANTEEMIFMPAFSTKRSKHGEYIGTGMGLFIVKSFVEEHSHGSVRVLPKGKLGGATFEITVPKADKTN